MSDALYVTCPRCKGDGTVFAYTSIGNGFTPSVGEYFSCPLCHGTGEADRQLADAWNDEGSEAEEP